MFTSLSISPCATSVLMLCEPRRGLQHLLCSKLQPLLMKLLWGKSLLFFSAVVQRGRVIVWSCSPQWALCDGLWHVGVLGLLGRDLVLVAYLEVEAMNFIGRAEEAPRLRFLLVSLPWLHPAIALDVAPSLYYTRQCLTEPGSRV